MHPPLNLEQLEDRVQLRKRQLRALTEEIAELQSSISFARSHFSAEDRRSMEINEMRTALLVEQMRGRPESEQGRIAGKYAEECGVTFAVAMQRYLRALGVE